MSIEIERIERALVVAAYLVTRHGTWLAPILERAEAELEKARRDDPAAKAKRILKQYNFKPADASKPSL